MREFEIRSEAFHCDRKPCVAKDQDRAWLSLFHPPHFDRREEHPRMGFLATTHRLKKSGWQMTHRIFQVFIRLSTKPPGIRAAPLLSELRPFCSSRMQQRAPREICFSVKFTDTTLPGIAVTWEELASQGFLNRGVVQLCQQQM